MNKSEWLPIDEKFATLAVHAGYGEENKNLSSVVPPITVSVNYEIDAPAVNRGYCYARTDNLSRKILEQKLAALENAKHAICYSSGMAAFSAVMALLKTGDHLLCSDDMFGGTVKQIMDSISRLGITADFIDMRDMKILEHSIKPETKMVFLESPANPTLTIFDLRRISEVAHSYNKDIIVGIDNTCLTSYFQRPLDLGLDVVHYSLTKYANGHADVIMGAVVTNNDKYKERLKFYQTTIGAIPGPFDCYLVTRGLKTLPIRMKAVMETSFKVAQFLSEHPKVDAVFHPGLKSHPGHEIAVKQSSGHSGLLSFRLKGDDESQSAVTFLKSLKLIQNAGSFGGCETLAELPAFFTHSSIPKESRLKLGITDNFVRLAIGLESMEDIIEDLDQALNLS